MREICVLPLPVFDLEVHEEAFWFFIAPGRSVRSQQYLVAHNQARVKDLIAPFSWHLFFRRRTRVRPHCFDSAVKTLLIELKCCLAVAIEKEIRV